MAYKVIILYRLYMPSYFLGTFTEYPYNSESVNVRMWAATYILPICECNAMQILQVIANGNNILLRLVAL